MKNKKSYKVLWNVFLFVICGGSLIYGFVQQRRMMESRRQIEKHQQQVDSLKMELEKANAQIEITLKQLQIEKNTTFSAFQEAKRLEQKERE